MKKIKQTAAVLLAAALTAGQGFLPAVPVCGIRGSGIAYGAETVVVIRTAEDLVQLSEKSVTDSYTRGSVFDLQADIDLSMVEFEPIASFGGTFRGNGHVISGLYWNQVGTDSGLFRFVEPDGVVENLIVHGTVKPSGSGKNTGGIVGTNRGRITGCTFRGRVDGKENTGGIAGVNEAGGLIEGCTNTAVVTGLDATGGIVGSNDGIVTDSLNRGEINTSEQVTDSEDENTSMSFGGRNILDAEKVYHTGGIAGRSTGTIRTSVNEALIGYPHAGYNTGGIVGMQNGYVDRCTNQGAVRGRKDTGGIVGQFEPYVRMRYEEDTIQKVQNQMDDLISQLDTLGDMAGDVGDDTVANMDAFRSDLKSMRSSLQSNKHDYYTKTKDFSGDLEEQLNRVESSMDEFDLEASDRNLDADTAELEAQVKHLKQLRAQLQQELTRDPEKAKELLDEMADTLKDIENTAGDLPGSLIDDVNDTTGQLRDQVDDLRGSVRDTRELIQDNKNQLFDDLEATNEELTARTDAAVGSMDVLLDRLKTANTDAQNQMKAIRSQMQLISDTISGRIDELKEDKDGELIDDVSDEEAEEPGSGMIAGCENLGRIESDSNTGGIAGIIGMELTLDPENDIEIDGRHSLKIDRTARASVRGCINREEVVSTNDYAGGIVGRADSGSLSENRSFGDVESKEGSYVGGVAGSSSNTARGNYVLCSLRGKDYVGGVTGKGENVTGNYTMVTITSEERGEYRGAVAGYSEGNVAGNYFVWNGVPAVNGVTYQEQAVQLPYMELAGHQGVPVEFGALTVSYYVGDELVKRVPVQFGKSVPESEIPEIPAKEGYYGFWEDREASGVTGNLRLAAQYRKWVTTMAAPLRSREIPVVLAEGAFYPDTELEAEAVDAVPGIIPAGYRAEGAYRYEVCSGQDGWSLNRLRVLADAKDGKKTVTAAALVAEDGTAVLADAVRDGSYLVIPADAAAGTVVLLSRSTGSLTAAVSVLAALLVLGGFWYVRKRRRQKKA